MTNRIINNTYHGFRNVFSKLYYSISDSLCIMNAPMYHKLALSRIKEKTQLKCVFLVLNESGWKYDYVFLKMLKNERFDPTIVICPGAGWGKEFMIEKMNAAKMFFSNIKGYPTIVSYDEVSGNFVDIRKELKPDIVFYCAPYRSTIDKRYFITNFLDTLTIYVPYAFNSSSDYKSFQDELLHNLVWRYYAETNEHKKYSVLNARNHGRNVVVSGYPAIEVYLDKNYIPSLCSWKLKDNYLKRIIWAPHHTIANTGTVIYSCFLRYCHFMVEMAEKYSDKVQIVFKPHPLLRPKLERLWGKEKTDVYFEKWIEMPNTSYCEGDYVDLFLTSDAMIHDSGSFIAEYLYVNKPVMRTMNECPIDVMYNPFAQKCLDNYYKAYSQEDIEAFIQQIINGEDSMKEKRWSFVKKYLLPQGLPSDNIISDILDSVDNQILYRN